MDTSDLSGTLSPWPANQLDEKRRRCQSFAESFCHVLSVALQSDKYGSVIERPPAVKLSEGIKGVDKFTFVKWPVTTHQKALLIYHSHFHYLSHASLRSSNLNVCC